MNTNALIGLIALVVVVGGGVWFFSTKDANGLPTGGASASAQGVGTFKDFVARGGNWSCTVSVNNPEAPTTGTVYLSGEQMRGDFVSTPVALGGQQIASYMIRTDGMFYTWTNLTAQGVKVAAQTTEGASPADQVINMSAEVQYDCQPWVADATKFAIPAEITFMDVQAQMQSQPQLPN